MRVGPGAEREHVAELAAARVEACWVALVGRRLERCGQLGAVRRRLLRRGHAQFTTLKFQLFCKVASPIKHIVVACVSIRLSATHEGKTIPTVKSHNFSLRLNA